MKNPFKYRNNKAAYSVYEFLDEDTWLSMLKSRNDMTHMYNRQASKQIVNLIVQKYILAFEKLQEEILKLYKDILKFDILLYSKRSRLKVQAVL